MFHECACVAKLLLRDQGPHTDHIRVDMNEVVDLRYSPYQAPSIGSIECCDARSFRHDCFSFSSMSPKKKVCKRHYTRTNLRVNLPTIEIARFHGYYTELLKRFNVLSYHDFGACYVTEN